MLRCLVLLTVFFAGVSVAQSSGIICVCKCCYLGTCTAIANASTYVNSCGACTSSNCNAYIQSDEAKQKSSQYFAVLQPGVPPSALSSRNYPPIDVCEVIAVLESVMCSDGSCPKQLTNMQSDCVDRNGFAMKFSIVSFVVVSVSGVVLGFFKNYIPALQEMNQMYFNY